ncbi:membrane protein [Equine parapoxvirus]|nr:membrane protein [Equine parapoxvirus]
MVDSDTHDVDAAAQVRVPNQETFFTRGRSPVMRHTYLYNNYCYGWIPETVVWSSRLGDYRVTDMCPVSLGMLKKFEFMFSLLADPGGQCPAYEPKLNTEFVDRGSFAGRFVSPFHRFAALPEREYISFLLLTSMPVFNILFWFKGEAFDVAKHSLVGSVFTTRERHVELARYMRRTGDYRPLFSRLDRDETFDRPFTAATRTKTQTPAGRLPPSEYETMANLSTILYFSGFDPVLMFLAFYVPGLSVTTKVTPAVEFLMQRLGLEAKDVVLV